MRSTSLAIEATIDQLDRLNQTITQRHRSDAESLRAIVGRLGDPWGVEGDVEPGERHERPTRIGPAGSAASDPEPFVPLPRTTTKPWGAPMREKFRQEAMNKGGW